jgi:hypothetical protein
MQANLNRRNDTRLLAQALVLTRRLAQLENSAPQQGKRNKQKLSMLYQKAMNRALRRIGDFNKKHDKKVKVPAWYLAGLE